MKTITLSFLLILVSACSTKKNISTQTNNSVDKKIEEIELTERTRGLKRSFTFSSTAFTTTSNGDSKKSKISLAEWESIEKQAKLLDVSKISSLAAPSTDHHSDRALASTLIITSNGSRYQSSNFDAANPPKELTSLYRAVQQIIQSKKTTQ
ncbi:MAG: hypothetical protein P0Y62_10930 [Candidatus Chryseobacterium colombiense]|nr:hypothetical protein [Chryseobacterium sp.]WEK68372.1 MAG: hypothetical protein P0Y62_10930 [Chryseobacterium sp.]